MREALAAMWDSIILTLTSFNKVVKTVDHYVSWAEAEAAAFAAEEALQRKSRLAKFEEQLELIPVTEASAISAV